jgi:hypothetical protein
MLEIEIATIIIAVATATTAMRLNRVVKILEERQRREEQTRRIRSLEPL